jgi:hypothetical protein
MHTPDIYTGHNTKDASHWTWLQTKHGKPVYMQERDARVPDSIAYPLKEAQELAGVKMFSSTFAYMAALAILKGYEEIYICGVELSATEYQYQANSYLFWFGFLRARLGDKVSNAVTFVEGNIFDAPLYGYEGAFTFGADYYAQRAKVHDAAWVSAEKNLTNIKSAIERAIGQKEYDKVQRLVTQYQGAAMTCGECAGAMAEAERYQAFGDRSVDRGGFETAAATGQKEGEEKKPFIWHYGGVIEYVWNIWKQSNGVHGEAQLRQFIETMGKIAYDTGAMLGAYKENIEYLMRYDAMVQANGGKK